MNDDAEAERAKVREMLLRNNLILYIVFFVTEINTVQNDLSDVMD